MIQRARQQGTRLKAAAVVALFAWIMLIGQTVVHASDNNHAELPSNHCVLCSVGGLDDDAITPENTPQVITPQAKHEFVAPEQLSILISKSSKPHFARGPPISLV